MKGLGAGIGAAAGFFEGGARIAANSIGEHFGWCKREPKTLSEFTIKGMNTGAAVGEIAGHVIGMPAALATTVVTAPLNLLYGGLPNALAAGLEVKRKGSSTRGDEKINQHILNFNQFIDNACKNAHTRLHGNEESPLDQLRKSLRGIGPVPA